MPHQVPHQVIAYASLRLVFFLCRKSCRAHQMPPPRPRQHMTLELQATPTGRQRRSQTRAPKARLEMTWAASRAKKLTWVARGARMFPALNCTLSRLQQGPRYLRQGRRRLVAGVKWHTQTQLVMLRNVLAPSVQPHLPPGGSRMRKGLIRQTMTMMKLGTAQGHAKRRRIKRQRIDIDLAKIDMEKRRRKMTRMATRTTTTRQKGAQGYSATETPWSNWAWRKSRRRLALMRRAGRDRLQRAYTHAHTFV